MQDPITLAQLAQNLQAIAAAFKEGGIFFLIGAISFLGYKVILAISARQRKASQEVTVNVPGDASRPDRQTEGGYPGHERRLASVETAGAHLETDLEKMRTENREDHGKIFTKLTGLEISTARIETEVRTASSAAISAANASAASAASAAQSASAAASSKRRFSQADPAR